ncbi:MGMT family protein [Lactococcus lactis]
MAEITENTKKILEVILNLKEGQVMSYRDVGALAGLPNGARQVSRILHSMSKKYELPWWRVVRSDRTIGLPEPAKSEQMELLKYRSTFYLLEQFIFNNYFPLSCKRNSLFF